MKLLVPMIHWDELVDIFLVKRSDHPGGIFDGEESREFLRFPAAADRVICWCPDELGNPGQG